MAPRNGDDDKASCSEGPGEVNDTSSKADSRCFLLELPPELQLIIYELVVVCHQPIKLKPQSFAYLHTCDVEEAQRRDQAAFSRWKHDKRLRLQPPLTATCKSIRQIALPIYFGSKIFEGEYFSHERTESFVAWLAAMGSRNRQLLRAVYAIDIMEDCDMCWPASLATFKSRIAQFHAEVVTVTASSGVRHRVTFPTEEVGETEESGCERITGRSRR